MSLHTRCPQRIASRPAHRTAWRRRGVRFYTSVTADDPEWFQQVRTELLSRTPTSYYEQLDRRHYDQLRMTLEGFQPMLARPTTGYPVTPLSDALTRFNARMPSSMLLSDGTDPLHSPGAPWLRRMWAGGAVRLSPSFEFGIASPLGISMEGSLGLWNKLMCFERIKDVQLRGNGAEAKIFVTIERSFRHSPTRENGVEHRPQQYVRAGQSQQAGHSDDDWGDAFMKEERHLVFLRPITTAELEAVHAGQLPPPRYLKSPTDPDYSHSLTPSRSLLFRYSALTENAHLLHLDPTYARNIEGHRNLLVHGPLTLTLMLQVLNRHVREDKGSPAVVSIEYRNLAPLYCDEAMRVCVKRRKSTDTATIWDVWIEGPTGGMAVKAVAYTARTVGRGSALPTKADVQGVETFAHAAQDQLDALPQSGTDAKLVDRTSRQESRPLERIEQASLVPYSRSWRKAWVGKALRYLYVGSSTPLLCPVDVVRPRNSARTDIPGMFREQKAISRARQRPKDFASSEEPVSTIRQGRPQIFAPFSRNWREARTGHALRYLYLFGQSALLRGAEVARPADPTPGAVATAPSSSSKLSTVPNLRFRKVEKETSPLWQIRDKTQRGTAGKEEESGGKPFGRVIKVELPSVRKSDIALAEAARKRAHQKRIRMHERAAGKRGGAEAEQKKDKDEV